MSSSRNAVVYSQVVQRKVSYKEVRKLYCRTPPAPPTTKKESDIMDDQVSPVPGKMLKENGDFLQNIVFSLSERKKKLHYWLRDLAPIFRGSYEYRKISWDDANLSFVLHSTREKVKPIKIQVDDPTCYQLVAISGAPRIRGPTVSELEFNLPEKDLVGLGDLRPPSSSSSGAEGPPFDNIETTSSSAERTLIGAVAVGGTNTGSLHPSGGSIISSAQLPPAAASGVVLPPPPRRVAKKKRRTPVCRDHEIDVSSPYLSTMLHRPCLNQPCVAFVSRQMNPPLNYACFKCEHTGEQLKRLGGAGSTIFVCVNCRDTFTFRITA